MHDVDVGNAHLIKQHPYRVNPIKLEKLRQEVQYMLDKDIIEPSQSNWGSNWSRNQMVQSDIAPTTVKWIHSLSQGWKTVLIGLVMPNISQSVI